MLQQILIYLRTWSPSNVKPKELFQTNGRNERLVEQRLDRKSTVCGQTQYCNENSPTAQKAFPPRTAIIEETSAAANKVNYHVFFSHECLIFVKPLESSIKFS